MVAAAPERPPQRDKEWHEKPISYVAIGAEEKTVLSLGMCRQWLAKPTAGGIAPSDNDLLKFMMLCKQNRLDPWVGDVTLQGYDTKKKIRSEDGYEERWVGEFSLIIANQALLKRAELNPDFNGLEYGVIVRVKETGEIKDNEGDFYDEEKEKVIGAWAACYRKNVDKVFRDRLNFSVFTTGKSRWLADPAGMIVKCAQASVLRTAFPNATAGCYTHEEMEHVVEVGAARSDGTIVPKSMDEALEIVEAKLGTPKIEHQPNPVSVIPAVRSGGNAEAEPVLAKPKTGSDPRIQALQKQIDELPEPEEVTAGPAASAEDHEPEILPPKSANQHFREQIELASDASSLDKLANEVKRCVDLDPEQKALLSRTIGVRKLEV